AAWEGFAEAILESLKGRTGLELSSQALEHIIGFQNNVSGRVRDGGNQWLIGFLQQDFQIVLGAEAWNQWRAENLGGDGTSGASRDSTDGLCDADEQPYADVVAELGIETTTAEDDEAITPGIIAIIRMIDGHMLRDAIMAHLRNQALDTTGLTIDSLSNAFADALVQQHRLPDPEAASN